MSEESSDQLTFTFQLNDPIKYGKGSEFVESSFIEFSSPTSRNMREASQLKQALSRAVVEAQSRASDSDIKKATSEDAKKAEDITGADIMQALTISSVPLEDVLEVGFKLLTSGVGRLGGEEKFNSNMAKDLPVDELERMVGEYAVNFSLRSFLA
jgi:hypothetical protein